MGRAHHLKVTLPINLRILENFPGTNIVLLDYNSADGLGGWIRECWRPQLSAGRLVYYFTAEPRLFRTAHAKNVAHRLADGELLCNLDADNVLTNEFVEEVMRELPPGCTERMLASYTPGGAYGRTVIPKVLFEQLGGYDEEFQYGWGYEDTDLRRRAERSGFRICVLSTANLSHLDHADDERVAKCATKFPSASEKMHAEISRIKIERGQLVANVGAHWGAANLIKNFQESIIV